MFKRCFMIVLSVLSLCTNGVDCVMLGLKQYNTEMIFNALEEVSNPTSPKYGQYWTQEEIDALVSPPQEQIESLINYLQSENIFCESMSGALKCSVVPDLNKLRLFTDLVEFIEEPRHAEHCNWHFGDNMGYVGREVINRLYNIKNRNVSAKFLCMFC